MRLKRQGYGQVAVILSANIIAISFKYMENTISLVSKLFEP